MNLRLKTKLPKLPTKEEIRDKGLANPNLPLLSNHLKNNMQDSLLLAYTDGYLKCLDDILIDMKEANEKELKEE